jgi:replicative DNA helicase
VEDRIPTGFMDLDSLLTGGFAPGQLVVVGARPAMGKTTLWPRTSPAPPPSQRIPTLIESLEMGEPNSADSILSAEARIPLHHIKQGSVTTSTWPAPPALPRITEAPLHINDARSCRCRCCGAASGTWCAPPDCAS